MQSALCTKSIKNIFQEVLKVKSSFIEIAKYISGIQGLKKGLLIFLFYALM